VSVRSSRLGGRIYCSMLRQQQIGPSCSVRCGKIQGELQLRTEVGSEKNFDCILVQPTRDSGYKTAWSEVTMNLTQVAIADRMCA